MTIKLTKHGEHWRQFVAAGIGVVGLLAPTVELVNNGLQFFSDFRHGESYAWQAVLIAFLALILAGAFPMLSSQGERLRGMQKDIRYLRSKIAEMAKTIQQLQSGLKDHAATTEPRG